MKPLKPLIISILLFIIVIPALLPLLKPGFFTMHDDQQVVRLALLDEALRAGQFPVRWLSGLGFGFGYPLFIFYPPLVYYLGEIYHLLGFNFINSIKLVFATAFLASALTMYYWAKHHFGRLPALVAAIFYTYAPYHAVDAYVRGALAELFAFVWLPLILLAIDKLWIKPKFRWFLTLIASYAALMLTHNLIFLPFSLILGVYLITKILLSKSKARLLSTSHTTLALTLGLLLTTFFWLPALHDKQFTLVDNILRAERYIYSLHYVEPQQLWNSLWGYGGSGPGPLDGISFKIGKPHLIASALSILLFLALKFRSKKINPFPILVPLVLLILSAYATTSYSSWLWDWFTPIQYLQFPWRFLTFTALFSSFLAGASVFLIAKLFKRTLIILIFALTLSALQLIPHVKLFTPQTFIDATDQDYLSEEFITWHTSKTSFEFVPKQVATTTDNELGITQVDINQTNLPISPYSVLGGQTQVGILTNKPHFKQFSLTVIEPTTFQLNTFYFPGWVAYVDSKPLNINPDNPLHLITVNIPPDSKHLSFTFSHTPLRQLADTISLITVLFLFWILIRRWGIISKHA